MEREVRLPFPLSLYPSCQIAASLSCLYRRAMLISNELSRLLEKAKEFQAASRSPNTWKAYDRDFSKFTAWCVVHRRVPMPADTETVVLYLVSLVDRNLAVATVARAAAAISKNHDLAGYASPTRTPEVKELLAGVRRAVGGEPSRRKPMTVSILAKIVSSMPDSLRGKRDRAIILLGFAAALRRSELVKLTCDDVLAHDSGLVLRIIGAKGDRENTTQRVAVPKTRRRKLCAIRALAAWMKAADITNGPVFRPICGHREVVPKALSDQVVAAVVKRALRRAGIDSKGFSGHSLRRGLITAAAHKGVSLVRLRSHSRHKTVQAMMPYVEDVEIFVENPVKTVLP